MAARKSSRRRDAVPPWHPKILIPSVLFGMPLAWAIRYIKVMWFIEEIMTSQLKGTILMMSSASLVERGAFNLV